MEAVAQAHLDAHPDDHRALAACRKWCRFWEINQAWVWLSHVSAYDREPFEHTALSQSWFDAGIALGIHSLFDTRRAAEDAASLAFARLPAERRARLLKGEM